MGYFDMVVIKDVQNMFWAVTLEEGKRYTQTVETTFHISMAALEANGTAPAPIMVAHDKSEYLLCTLEAPHTRQQNLDLNFTEGEEVTFFHTGKGVVHLTGYLMPEDEHPFDESGMEDSSEEESDIECEDDAEAPELVQATNGKRKL